MSLRRTSSHLPTQADLTAIHPDRGPETSTAFAGRGTTRWFATNDSVHCGSARSFPRQSTSPRHVRESSKCKSITLRKAESSCCYPSFASTGHLRRPLNQYSQRSISGHRYLTGQRSSTPPLAVSPRNCDFYYRARDTRWIQILETRTSAAPSLLKARTRRLIFCFSQNRLKSLLADQS